MEQGSDAWLLWRKAGIGSSDIPVIMNESPWVTPFQLYQQRLGLSPPREKNWAMMRGNELEGKIRAKFELEQGESFEPCLLMLDEHPFMRVSLDGRSEDKKRIIEIKTASVDKHAAAAKGCVPQCYVGQVQYQLLVSQADFLYYISYHEATDTTHVVRVLHDKEYQHRMLVAVLDFWHRLQEKIPPDYVAEDFKNVRSKDAKAALELWRITRRALLDAEEKEQSAREHLISIAGSDMVRVGDMRIIKGVIQGE